MHRPILQLVGPEFETEPRDDEECGPVTSAISMFPLTAAAIFALLGLAAGFAASALTL